MAKTYITIKLSYNTTETEIDVRLTNEDQVKEDIFTVREAIDGTPYYQKTGERISWEYSFNYATEDVYDFFKDAYDAFQAGQTVTFERENDSGAFDSYTVIISRPEYEDDTVGTTDKVYADLACRIRKIS